MRTKTYYESNKEAIDALSQALKVNTAYACLMHQRNIESIEEAKHYLNPAREDLKDFSLLKNSHKAADYLEHHIQSKHRIMLYGDYDVDGTSSIALLYQALRLVLDEDLITTYFPDRKEEGYGISVKGIEHAIKNDISLVIAVDCGTKDFDSVQLARDHSIHVIICDHHEVGEEIPNAIYINPKQHDCEYPFTSLSGCGVLFGMLNHWAKTYHPKLDMYQFIDYVAISITCDMVALEEDNRVLASLGLEAMRQGNFSAPNIPRLIGDRYIDEESLTFYLGPKINAAGRLQRADMALEALIGDDARLVDQLDKENSKRRSLTQSMTKEALAQIHSPQYPYSNASLVWLPKGHSGVAGLVASRLVETNQKPAIILCGDEEEATGSARSAGNLNLYNLIQENEYHLLRWGGHHAAAGMSLKKESVKAFFLSINDSIGDTSYALEKTKVDCMVSFASITPTFCQNLMRFGPFGMGNSSPVFCAEGITLRSNGLRSLGSSGSHYRLTLCDPQGNQRDALYFNAPRNLKEIISGPFCLVFSLRTNLWRGVLSWDIVIKEIWSE